MKTSFFKLILLYLISFLIFLITLFPYSGFVDYQIRNAIKRYRIPVTYTKTEVSLTKLKLLDVVVQTKNGIKLGSAIIKFSLFSIFSKKFKITINGSYLDIKVNDKIINFSGVMTKNLLPEYKEYLCDYHIKGVFNTENRSGNIKITSLSSCSVNTRLGTLLFNTVEADIKIKNGKITVNANGTSKNKKLSLKGVIRLNPNNFEKSLLSLQGFLKIKNLNKRFSIGGYIGNPKFNIN